MTTTSFRLLPFLRDSDRLTWILGAGLLILYGPLVVYWYDGWLNHTISLEHEYFSHGVLGLPLAAKTVWDQRERWQALNDRWNPLGAVLMGFAAALYLSGISDTVNLSFPLLLTAYCCCSINRETIASAITPPPITPSFAIVFTLPVMPSRNPDRCRSHCPFYFAPAESPHC